MQDGENSSRRSALRNRTDEIELIISGLSMVALFTLPGWLLDRYIDMYPHMSVSIAVAAEISLMVVSGLCFTLGVCFLAHLLIRAYWVGLIGLKAAYPVGIDWTKTPGIGPRQREYYQKNLPDLASAIAHADRLASSLFAVIGLIAITVLWIAVLLTAAAVIGGLVGGRSGHTQAGMFWALTALAGGMATLPILTLALDVVAGRKLGERAGFRTLIARLTRVYGWIYPQRLILPVQLTLQSNSRPWMFVIVLTAGMIALIMVGQLNWHIYREFTLSGEYHYLSSEDARAGLRSSHYEDRRSDKDRVRLFPMIPSLTQSGSFVPLFLPYHPLRDNLVLDQLCVEPEASAGTDCLRQLWQVQINGRDLAMDGFIASERLDLRMRGLTGFVPTVGLAPGVHRIEVTWNPAAGADDAPPDDRLTYVRTTYSIPFLFAPEFELGLDDSGRVPATSPADESP